MPNPEGLDPIPEEIITDLSPWGRLFSIIAERARVGEYNVAKRHFQGRTTMIEDLSPVRVVVNPKLSPSEVYPSIIAVNLYAVKAEEDEVGEHFQEFTAFSAWEEGVPIVPVVDVFISDYWKGIQATPESAAILAEEVTTGIIRPRIFPVPGAGRIQ